MVRSFVILPHIALQNSSLVWLATSPLTRAVGRTQKWMLGLGQPASSSERKDLNHLHEQMYFSVNGLICDIWTWTENFTINPSLLRFCILLLLFHVLSSAAGDWENIIPVCMQVVLITLCFRPSPLYQLSQIKQYQVYNIHLFIVIFPLKKPTTQAGKAHYIYCSTAQL